jgi:hypothetical protein
MTSHCYMYVYCLALTLHGLHHSMCAVMDKKKKVSSVCGVFALYIGAK